MSENTLTLSNTSAVVNAIRYTVKARGTWLTFVTENKVTREQIAETAKALAVLAYPDDAPVQTVPMLDEKGEKVIGANGKPVQVRTRFGNAVQAAGNGMRSVLNADGSTDTTTKNLLTATGKAATLDEVIAEWHASQK